MIGLALCDKYVIYRARGCRKANLVFVWQMILAIVIWRLRSQMVETNIEAAAKKRGSNSHLNTMRRLLYCSPSRRDVVASYALPHRCTLWILPKVLMFLLDVTGGHSQSGNSRVTIPMMGKLHLNAGAIVPIGRSRRVEF